MNILQIKIEDYPSLMELWNSVGMSKRALNSIDDSHEGIERYLKRNPETCFKSVDESGNLLGVILSGHDGRRGLVHHLCVNPMYQHRGIGTALVKKAEEALQKEGIQKIFLLVYNDNEKGNKFWEKQGYSVRTNIVYRNKSLNKEIPVGE
ncbi:MAG: GNAT family N-acetyltransferase [Treponema sp.]|nr:GNAT family N-acetyltransferase [Candidatus Treponema equifaecale]